MKTTASMFGNLALAASVVEAYPLSNFARKCAARATPGGLLETADGSYIRVLARGNVLGREWAQISHRGAKRNVGLAVLAGMDLVSPAMRRLAGFIHQIVASESDMMDSYVKEAIKAAGLPVDTAMNWSKYLNVMYGKLLTRITSDQDTINDAILSVVVNELYTKRVLSPDSPYAKFDPDFAGTEGKELSKKVTAFLIQVFKNRKTEVVDYATRAQGIGAAGELGKAQTDPLVSEYDAEEENAPGVNAPGAEDAAFDEFEGNSEVKHFLAAYMAETSKLQRADTAKILNFISKKFGEGLDRSELKDLVIDNPEFKGRKGGPLNRDGWNYFLREWAMGLRRFAQDDSNKWSTTPIAKTISRAAKDLVNSEEKASPAKKHHMAGLHLADFVGNEDEQAQPGQPVPPNQPNQPPAPLATPPPPVNPNVQQQNTLKQQMGAPAPTPNAPVPPKVTIAPEIPGVNHTASEKTMSIPTIPGKKATRRIITAADKATLTAPKVSVSKAPVDKHATLRRIAMEQTNDVADSFTDLSTRLAGLSSRFANLCANLNLTRAPRTASVREKIASRNRFGKGLRTLAAESPEEMSAALSEFYQQLDHMVTDTEVLADNLGVELADPVDNRDAEEAAEQNLAEQAAASQEDTKAELGI